MSVMVVRTVRTVLVLIICAAAGAATGAAAGADAGADAAGGSRGSHA